ncbi:MAG: 2-phospho-L-lactate guanylyltransferase [Anaerolineales bacterium]|nr:2-phospho-L-lactate guanylyltransferase [Anaerolineales bacterium]
MGAAFRMKCWAIVPVKRLSAAKSRLAPALTLRRRRELVLGLLVRTLKVLGKVEGIEKILVAGKDRAVRRIAAQAGAEFVPEGVRGGMNRALARAAAEAGRRGAESLLILPADLPLLAPTDVTWALARRKRQPFFAISPDRAGRGTNLLLVAPPGLIRFSFGRFSFVRHLRAARQAGVNATVLSRRALAWDLDRPEDLDWMGKLPPSGGSGSTRRAKKNPVKPTGR